MLSTLPSYTETLCTAILLCERLPCSGFSIEGEHIKIRGYENSCHRKSRRLLAPAPALWYRSSLQVVESRVLLEMMRKLG